MLLGGAAAVKSIGQCVGPLAVIDTMNGIPGHTAKLSPLVGGAKKRKAWVVSFQASNDCTAVRSAARAAASVRLPFCKGSETKLKPPGVRVC